MQTQGYFVECGAALTPERNNTRFPFTRNHYMAPEEVVNFANHYGNIDVYKTSIVYINPFWYLNSKGKWRIDTQRTLKWSDFYLDFDKVMETEEDHQKIKEDVEMAIRYITLIFNIPERYVQIYFSGNKGYHLIVGAHAIGIEPHLKINSIYKDIAEEISQYTKNESLDLAIYDDKRLFRINNTINDKSGLYKIPLTTEEFRKVTLEDLKVLATQPRQVDFPNEPIMSRAKQVCEDIIDKWNRRAETQEVFSEKVLNIKEAPPCIKEMHKREFRETIDERNNSGTALASYYFQRDYSFEDTLDIIHGWGTNNCTPALKNDDIKTIVESVYNGRYRYGCNTFERVSGVCDKENCPLFQKKESSCSLEEGGEKKKKTPYEL